MRVHSIDVFRAVTMVLMIFVNDFWTLEHIPQWLKHMPGQADGLGFSDTIFPAFLFIVGLSIPFAIDHRLDKESSGQVVIHILTRSLALIIMGVFLVNLENIFPAAMMIPKQLWQVLLIVAFMLVWNNYEKTELSQGTVKVLVGAGVILLLLLAYLYKGGSAEDVHGMRRHWWGILGLIGWAYLISALIYLVSRGKLIWVGLGFLVFMAYNYLDFTGILDFLEILRLDFWLTGHASHQALVMGGVLTSVLFRIYREKGTAMVFQVLLILGTLLIIYGFMVRPSFGISKIRATPAWTSICMGISVLAFLFFYWLIDLKKMNRWTQIIRPAGRSTLTCYLVPYVYYAIWSIWAITLPEFIRTGLLGLIKSLLFALLIVSITGLLNRWKISLKI